MDPITADLLLTIAASASLVGLGAASVAVLPWSGRELRASAAAWRALGTLGVRTARALASWGTTAPGRVAPPVPVRAEPVTLVPLPRRG